MNSIGLGTSPKTLNEVNTPGPVSPSLIANGRIRFIVAPTSVDETLEKSPTNLCQRNRSGPPSGRQVDSECHGDLAGAVRHAREERTNGASQSFERHRDVRGEGKFVGLPGARIPQKEFAVGIHAQRHAGDAGHASRELDVARQHLIQIELGRQYSAQKVLQVVDVKRQ